MVECEIKNLQSLNRPAKTDRPSGQQIVKNARRVEWYLAGELSWLKVWPLEIAFKLCTIQFDDTSLLICRPIAEMTTTANNARGLCRRFSVLCTCTV